MLPCVLQVKGQRRITFDQFVNALGIIAEKKGQALRDVAQAVLDAGGPSAIGTRAGYVKFHDDKVWQLQNDASVLSLLLKHKLLLLLPCCLLTQSIAVSPLTDKAAPWQSSASTCFCACCCTLLTSLLKAALLCGAAHRLHSIIVLLQSLYTGVYSRGGPTNIEPSNELSALLDRSPADVRGVKFSGSPGVSPWHADQA